MEEAAAGKARLPTVDNLIDGTMRRVVAAERRVRRPGMSATRVSGPGIAVQVSRVCVTTVLQTYSREMSRLLVTKTRETCVFHT